VSTRKTSGELEGISPPSIVEEPSTPAEKTPVQANFRHRAIQEQPRSDMAGQTTSAPAAKPAPAKVEAPKPTPAAKPNVEETRAKVASSATANKPAASSSSSTLRNGGVAETTNGTSGGKGKGKAVAKEASITAAGGPSKAATRTVPIMITKTASKPTKSPTVAKPPKSPATTTPKLSAKTTERKAAHPEKTSTPKSAASAAKASGSSSVQRPPPLQPSPSSTGFIKPKVKSPTRPVKLPPGLTTHTAASGSKVNVPRQSLSRASGTYNHADPQARSLSRISVSTVGTTKTATAGKSLRRQNSTINRPRPSLGPPPKPTARDHPPTKKEKEVDESFLSRMMRPTQASSSKTADKAPVTPPRKLAAAPAAKRTIPNQALKMLKKHPAKIVAASASASTSASPSASTSSGNAQSSARVVARAPERASAQEAAPVADVKPVAEKPSAQAVAPTVERPVTPEQASSVTKEAEHPISSPEATSQEATTQEIAPVVEQLETAEEVVEVAKSAEGAVLPPSEEKVGSDSEVTPSKVADDPEPAPATSLEAEEPESVEAPTLNGDHEKSAPIEEAEVPAAEPAVESVDELETKENVVGEQEAVAA